MSNAPVPEDKIQEFIRLRRLGKSCHEIARMLDFNPSTVSKAIKKYAPEIVAGEPPPRRPRANGEVTDRRDVDGTILVTRDDRPATVEEMMAACGADPKTWVPQYFTGNAWQGFAKMKVEGADKLQKVQLFQSKLTLKKIIGEEMEAAILEFVQKHVRPVTPIGGRRRTGAADPFMVSWGLWDAHLGMYAWNSEVGADFDCDIARHRILNSVDDIAQELERYPIARIVMPIGNDFMHFDSVRNTTAFGQHFLDTDTRFARVFQIGLECLAYMIERAAQIAPRVDVLYVPGNHDTTSSYALCAALQQRYRNEENITVDLGANPRKYITHGGVLLGFDHGGDARAPQLAQIFATEARKEWSASTYREIQVGHTHQKREQNYAGTVPTNGVLVRTNPALCNVDLWHHRQGLIGEPMKSVEAWRYDTIGFRGSHVAWARDEEPKGKTTK